MKKLIIFGIIFLLSCQPDWNNPMETDSDLKDRPIIKELTLTEDNNIQINLGRVYSDSVQFILERNENGIYVPITPVRFNLFSLLDTSFDKENQHNFTYRYRIKKGKYQSEYCEPKSIQYPAKFIYPPNNFRQQTIELQGIRFYWHDRSKIEDNYVVEKDSGAGYQVIAELPSNTETYFDAMAGVFDPPVYLRYRIYAKHGSQQSTALEYETEYSGLGSPTNLQIADSSTWHFTIKWQDNSNIEDGYEVERSKDGAGFQVLKKLSANSTEFVDDITELGEYKYRVRAYKNKYYSGYSNEVKINVINLIPTEGLMAYYPFNGNANDESGNGNNGTVYGPVLTKDRFGETNRAYLFDGIDDYIWVGEREELKLKKITVALWYKFKSINQNQGNIIRWRLYGFTIAVNPYDNYENGHINLKKVGISFWINSDNNKKSYSYIYKNELNEDEWQFVGFSYDGSVFNAYINGRLVYTANTYSGNLYYERGGLAFGRDGDANLYFYSGAIDDVRIYNRALSESEINALYHEGGWNQ